MIALFLIALLVANSTIATATTELKNIAKILNVSQALQQKNMRVLGEKFDKLSRPCQVV